jgi:hypothetical protein
MCSNMGELRKHIKVVHDEIKSHVINGNKRHHG